MIINLPYNDIEKNIKSLSKQFETEVKRDCQEFIVEIPSSYGKGKITAFSFDYGLNLLILDCRLKENLKIIIEKDQIHPIHFHFCVKGDFRHYLAEGGMSYQLNPLVGSITTNPEDSSQTFYFPKGVDILHTNLQITRAEYLKKVDCDVEKMPKTLAKVFQDVGSKIPFLYESNYTVPTSECIKSIIGVSYEGLVRSAYTEAKALELLSLQLKQFSDDLNPEKHFITLKKYDLDLILQAKEMLIANLQNAPTIVELAKMSGINQQKLKKGFKQVFGTTINQYLRNTRMETAKFLIMEGKSSINAVAQRVGYSNQSHFARRFKEKYGVLPKNALRISIPKGAEETRKDSNL